MLFLLGTYTDGDAWLVRDIYPYFLFLWLNVIDLKCIKFI